MTHMAIVRLANGGDVRVKLSTEDVKSAVASFGMEARGSTTADLQARIKADVDKWAKVIEKAGIEKK